MSKYDALTRWLDDHNEPVVDVTFAELDRILGGLPASARKYPAWWANSYEAHYHAKGWLDAGRHAQVDFNAGRVRFSQARLPAARRGSPEADPPASTRRTPPRAPNSSRTSRRTAMSGQRFERVRLRLERLVAEFDDYVSIYDEQVPFRRTGQYELHRQTIDRRYQYGHVADAIADDSYIDLLHRTLGAWGIGRRRSRLLAPTKLAERLRAEVDRLSELDDLHIENLATDAERVGETVWEAVEALRVVDNISLFVSGTKTMHHLFPDLVPPMDRAYTGEFFGWAPQALQYEQRRTFLQAWAALVGVADQTAPSRLVGEGWRSTPAKILDNAIVAYMLTDETLCPGCGSVGVFEIDDDAVIAAPPDLDDAVPAPMPPTHTCRSCGAHIAVRLDDD